MAIRDLHTKTSLTAIAAALLLMTTFGCAGTGNDASKNNSGRGALFGTTQAVRSEQNKGFQSVRPSTQFPTGPVTSRQGVKQDSLFAAALVAPLDRVMYDGRLLPLVRPSGGYMAVQQGGTTPWEMILARPNAPPSVYTTVTIYRIELDQQTRHLRLVEQHRLDDVGVIGRSCDDAGFLVESQQMDGSRWIGKVNWESGNVNWILKGGTDKTVNAYAAVSPDGRLAWCARSGLEGDEDRLGLYIQSEGEIYTAPAESDGEWLFPIWANDGRSLFCFRLQDDGLLELVMMDTNSQAAVRRPIAKRRIAVNGTRFVAFQCQAALQQPAAPDGSPRLLFYHPAYDRICLFDPRTPGLRAFTRLTVSAAWMDDQRVVVGSFDSLLLEDAVETATLAVKLAKRSYAIRRTADPTHPFILFAPAAKRMNELECWAMDVITDPAEAEAASIPLNQAKSNRR